MFPYESIFMRMRNTILVLWKVFIPLLWAIGVFVPAHAQYQGKIDSLLRVENITTDHHKKVDILIQLSTFTLSDDPDLSIEHAQRADAIAGNVNYTEGKAEALTCIANVYLLENEFEKALEYLTQAAELFEETENNVGLTENMLAIAQVYQEQGDFAHAMNSIQEALAKAEQINDSRLIALCHSFIGNLWYSDNKDPEARDAYLISFNVYRNAYFDRDFAPAISNLGELFFLANDYEKASTYLTYALNIYSSTGEMNPMVELNYYLGSIYFDQEQYELALEYFNQCLNLAQTTDNEDYVVSSYEKISEAYAAKGNFKDAYLYMNYYASTKNSTTKSMLETQMEATENKMRAQDLAMQEARLQSELDSKNMMVYFMLGVFALVVIFMVVLIAQIRQRNQANAQLQKAKEKAERSESEKEKFLAYTSHEIRTPLNALVGMVELLKKTPLSEEQDKFVSTIKTSSDNIVIIANDILDLTKIDSGKIEFESINFILSELVDELIFMLQVKARAKGLILKVNYDKSLPPVIVGDPLRLSQILMNLINNAIKFTEKGEVAVDVHCLHQYENLVKIGFTVTDTGIGIRKERLKNVFNRFEQEDKDTTRKYGGAGLGLSITKQLVELQGGSISVRSRWGEGTTFSVRLEYPEGDFEQVSREEEALIPAEEMGDFSLLLVDDNMLNRTILSDLLLDWNPRLKIDQAENGKRAIEKIRANDYAIILMDIQMPEMNGYQASTYIREQFLPPKNKVPVIAMTAHALGGIADKIVEAGMDDYVSKPINMSHLVKKLSEHLKIKLASPKKVYSTINLDHLKQLTNNDEQKIVKYIDIFLKNFKQDREQLQKHLEAENWVELSRVAHKMKGTTSYMGIKELELIFADAQHYGEEDINPGELEEVLMRIDSLCDAAVDELLEVKENL